MRVVEIVAVDGMGQIDASAWDALGDPNHPFVDHAFLHALEESGAVSPRAGWAPTHVLARRGGSLCGAMPLYVKNHSAGEFIFDHGWAHGAQRAGIPYFPKLVCAVPFTPATGSRVLGTETDLLLQGVEAVADHHSAGSAHVLFLPASEAEAVARRPGWFRRRTWQYHFTNQGWPTFDDLLGSFHSRARKEIRRERRRVAESGLTIRTRTGDALSAPEWQALYPLYRRTVAEKGSPAYLPERFFRLVREKLNHRVVVASATDRGEVVAAALAFQKGDALYGRYWGTTHDLPGLHFELCLYQLLEFALTHGIIRFEAGAQGEHKIRRGFMPTATHSVHWIRHPALRAAVEAWVVEEAIHNQATMEALAASSPFRDDGAAC